MLKGFIYIYLYIFIYKYTKCTVDDLKLCLLLYADDSVLIAESRLDLQNSLDSVHDYCQRWKLCVNILKTKIVVLGRVEGYP